MKTKIFLLLILIAPYYTKAQHNYVPMAIEGAQWVYYNSDDDDIPPFDDYYFGYKIEGDTIINNLEYKKVYYRRFEPVENDGGPAYPPVYISQEYLYGAIRDDIPNKKVYGIQFCDPPNEFPPNNCPCDEEFLLYGFDMNIGDIFNEFCIVEGSDISLVNISLLSIFNENRLLYSMTNDWGFFLEGIGNYSPYDGLNWYGLFNSMGLPFGCPCTSFILYCIGTDEECLDGFLNLNVETNQIIHFNIFPNPVKDCFYIEGVNNLRIENIKIYDILGHLIYKKIYKSNPINISHLNDGIFFIRIETNQGVLTKEIIKTSM